MEYDTAIETETLEIRARFSVSLEKDLYFFASFSFYFLVSDTQSQTSVMVSFNIETLSGENPPL